MTLAQQLQIINIIRPIITITHISQDLVGTEPEGGEVPYEDITGMLTTGAGISHTQNRPISFDTGTSSSTRAHHASRESRLLSPIQNITLPDIR